MAAFISKHKMCNQDTPQLSQWDTVLVRLIEVLVVISWAVRDVVTRLEASLTKVVLWEHWVIFLIIFLVWSTLHVHPTTLERSIIAVF